jgi:hypothetical protein
MESFGVETKDILTDMNKKDVSPASAVYKMSCKQKMAQMIKKKKIIVSSIDHVVPIKKSQSALSPEPSLSSLSQSS